MREREGEREGGKEACVGTANAAGRHNLPIATPTRWCAAPPPTRPHSTTLTHLFLDSLAMRTILPSPLLPPPHASCVSSAPLAIQPKERGHNGRQKVGLESYGRNGGILAEVSDGIQGQAPRVC